MQQQLVEEVFGAHVFNEILKFINDLIFVILFYGHVLANNLANELQQVIRYEDGAIYSQSQRNPPPLLTLPLDYLPLFLVPR